MSHLPQPGDAKRAAATFSARVDAASNGQVEIHTGPISVHNRSGALGGDLRQMLQVYGDLFDTGELLTDGGLAFLLETRAEIKGPSGILPALVSVYLQGVGIGVLMERQRWERERRVPPEVADVTDFLGGDVPEDDVPF